MSVFLSLFTICSLGIPSIALATPTNLDYTHNTLTYLEKEELRTEFNMYGVDKSTSEQLIKKFESGQLWDSLSPDSTPKSNKVIRSDNTITTLYEYNDGSIKVTTVPDFVALESEKVSNTEKSINGCQYRQSGSTRYWTNCDATVNLLVVSMGFYFDYQNVNHKNPKITKYNRYHHHIIGGSLSNFRFDRISASQVRLSADFDVAFEGFPVGWTAWMQVNVTGDNAWTSNN